MLPRVLEVFLPDPLVKTMLLVPCHKLAEGLTVKLSLRISPRVLLAIAGAVKGTVICKLQYMNPGV